MGHWSFAETEVGGESGLGSVGRNWRQAIPCVWAGVVTSLFSSVQFRCSVVSDFLRPHGLQHARLPVC